MVGDTADQQHKLDSNARRMNNVELVWAAAPD